MSSDARKPVFGVSDKVRLKPVCLATWTSYNNDILYGTIIYSILCSKLKPSGIDLTARMRRQICAFLLRDKTPDRPVVYAQVDLGIHICICSK